MHTGQGVLTALAWPTFVRDTSPLLAIDGQRDAYRPGDACQVLAARCWRAACLADVFAVSLLASLRCVPASSGFESACRIVKER